MGIKVACSISFFSSSYLRFSSFFSRYSLIYTAALYSSSKVAL